MMGGEGPSWAVAHAGVAVGVLWHGNVLGVPRSYSLLVLPAFW